MKHLPTKYILFFILLLAALLRIVYLGEIRKIPFYNNPVGDAKNYVARAEEIYMGKIIPDESPFLSSAAYPYFLALTFKIAHNLTTPRIIQFIVGLVNVLVVYFLVLLLFGSPTAIIAALLTAIYPVFIFFEGDLLMISLIVFTINVSLLFFVLFAKNRKIGYLIAGGIFLGISALGKPDTILLAPVIALWLFFSSTERKNGLIHTGILTLAVTLTILPLTVLNWLVEKEFILLTSNGGVNFYIGNHPDAPGIFAIPPQSGLAVDGLHKISHRVAEYHLQKKLKPSDVSKYWFQRGTQFIKDNPMEFILLLAKKSLLMINRFEVPNHHSFYFYKSRSFVLRFIFLNLSIIIFFACIGLLTSLEKRSELALLYIYLTVMFVVSVFFFISDRYRLPVVSILIIFCSYGIYKTAQMIKEKQWSKNISVIIPAVMLFGLSWIPLSIFDHSFKHDYKNLGNVYFGLKQYDQAIYFYRTVLEQFPAEQFVHANIAKSYYMQQNYSGAIQEFEAEIKVNPNFSEPYLHLATIYMQKNELQKAEQSLRRMPGLENSYPGLMKLGKIYMRSGKLQDALRIFEAMSKSYPNDKEVQNIIQTIKTQE
ncbi:MAG: glycosyltransferase family 39 protein [Candidatus Auribacterota bacterium]